MAINEPIIFEIYIQKNLTAIIIGPQNTRVNFFSKCITKILKHGWEKKSHTTNQRDTHVNRRISWVLGEKIIIIIPCRITDMHHNALRQWWQFISYPSLFIYIYI